MPDLLTTGATAAAGLATGVVAAATAEWRRRQSERPQGVSVDWRKTCAAQRELLLAIAKFSRADAALPLTSPKTGTNKALDECREAAGAARASFRNSHLLVDVLPIRQGARAVHQFEAALSWYERRWLLRRRLALLFVRWRQRRNIGKSRKSLTEISYLSPKTQRPSTSPRPKGSPTTTLKIGD
jgi:hypothetical protein